MQSAQVRAILHLLTYLFPKDICLALQNRCKVNTVSYFKLTFVFYVYFYFSAFIGLL